MTIKRKIKVFSRHERFTAIIGGVALVLLALSCGLGKDDTWIGILQGLSTGLLAGVILLFVTGIKNQELICNDLCQAEIDRNHHKLAFCVL